MFSHSLCWFTATNSKKKSNRSIEFFFNIFILGEFGWYFFFACSLTIIFTRTTGQMIYILILYMEHFLPFSRFVFVHFGLDSHICGVSSDIRSKNKQRKQYSPKMSIQFFFQPERDGKRVNLNNSEWDRQSVCVSRAHQQTFTIKRAIHYK